MEVLYQLSYPGGLRLPAGPRQVSDVRGFWPSWGRAISRFDRVGRLTGQVAETMADMSWTICESPVGALTVVAGAAGVRGIYFEGQGPRLDGAERREMAVVAAQLSEYFAGERQGFELELDLRGEPLQLAVWNQLRTIPYGETTSYGELTRRVDPSLFPAELEPYKRVRLAAATIGRTPTPIVVPCHRVIGADGSLTGYGGGLDRKRALLELERRVAGPAVDEDADQLALL
jgi:methylated-DNA-[protein]-cysteine S-methyltransferase